MDTASPSKKTSNRSLIGLIVILLVAVVAAFAWWWNYRKYISTDDANLDSYRIHVAARVMAPMLTLHAQEGDTVKAGALLAELDSSNVTAQLQEAIARRNQLTANLLLNKENRHTATKTQIAAGEAAIAAANASIESIRIDLGYYRITAPVDGVIAKRWSLPGDIVQPGQTLFTINKGTDIWVAVYLEETKFSTIRLGQPATFTLDAYPDLTFSGNIYYIGTNAASEFSLIPPNNASGNYTKIAQRIPLKISIERMEGKASRQEQPKLVSGMSATVKIIKEK